MSKKSVFYVILSGLMTAGAVLGWSSGGEEKSAETPIAQQPVAQIQAVEDNVKPVEAQTGNKSIQETVLTALTAGDDALLAAVKTVSESSRILDGLKPSNDGVIRLATPEQPPQIGAQAAPKRDNASSILDALNENETLKRAKSLALVDLMDIGVVAAADETQAFELMALLPDNSNKSGVVLHVRDNALEKLIYQCIGEKCQHMLLASFAATLDLNDENRCQMADASFISCGESVVDNAGLMSGCTPMASRQAILDVLKTQSATQGTLDADGKKWQFAKSSVNGCEVAVVAEVVEAAQHNDEQVAAMQTPLVADAPMAVDTVKENGDKCRVTPIAIAKASAAGILMILLGLVCIRRKEEKVIESKNSSEPEKDGIQKKCQKLTEERDTAVREKVELDKKISKLEIEAGEADERNRQLSEQLEFAKNAFKQEQLQRMSIAEENRRLEDALAASQQDHTHVSNPSVYSKNAGSSSLPLMETGNDKETQDLQKVDANRVTSQAPIGGIEQSQAFFESLTDEGWDEIEDSFDAIFTPSKTNLAALEGGAPLEDLKASSSFGKRQGFAELFSGLDDSDKRVDNRVAEFSAKHITTETSLKPVLDSKQNQLPTIKPRNDSNSSGLPTFNKGNAEKALAKGMTLNGLSTINKPAVEKSVTESASEMAIRRNGDVSDSFKPSPSWTGKSVVQDKGMDENSLFNALKRRAKDVSEMEEASKKESTKPSGALEYNRGLSKSGIFSVTGSRVDIDPLSDIEYFKSLYDKYIKVQKECGESTNKFTMEQFVSRLSREKAELMKKYKCSNVVFTVTAKNGKASLKASPKA